MRKIIKDLKAGAVPMIAIVIVAILVVAGLYIYIGSSGGGSSSDYWETPAEFGMWEDEIIIKYDDGSTASFKMLQDSTPLTVTHEGKAVSEIVMRLRAKVTGSGFDGADIQTNTLGYTATVKGGGNQYGVSFSLNSNTYNVPVGSTQQLAYGVLTSTQIESYTKIPDGSATIVFIPKGEVSYRGYPNGGDWQTASLPPTRTLPITISRTPTGSITVTLSSEL